MAFPCSLALANNSLILFAPTPTYISTKSEPVAGIKGTFASPATALASRVFPVPGGPTSKAPLGIFAPSFANRSLSFKNSTSSLRSSIASSQPATSAKVVVESPDATSIFVACSSFLLVRLFCNTTNITKPPTAIRPIINVPKPT